METKKRREARVHFYSNIKTITAAAVLSVFAYTGTMHLARAQAPAEKKWKAQEEFDLYSAAGKDLAANGFAKAITGLDAWKQKYAESDYKDLRTLMYVQAYAGAAQQAKAVDTAAELLSKDLETTFSDPATGPSDIIKLLFTTTVAIQQVPNPTPEELATGQKAAHQLMDFNKKPQGVPDAAWTQARGQLQTAAKGALLSMAVRPGQAAMAKQPPDCPAAEEAYAKALEANPDSAFIAYELAKALRCQQKEKPEKIAQAIYEFQRAAVIDPTLGDPKSDPKKIQAFADNAYIIVHGSNEGLDQLKQQVKQSPLPPAGFKIKTATEISTEKEAEFEKTNPQLALWMKLKGLLSDTNGEQYFAGTLKDSAVPKLKGTLVEAKPACRPKELLVALPLPDAQGTPRAEVTLKLDKPMTGKPELNTEFQWQGVPSVFTRDPFMLTMETETAKVEGLKSAPCAGSPARAPVRKKSAGGKKRK
jgi:tetratricopeptide (TPR) repeat protein